MKHSWNERSLKNTYDFLHSDSFKSRVVGNRPAVLNVVRDNAPIIPLLSSSRPMTLHWLGFKFTMIPLTQLVVM